MGDHGGLFTPAAFDASLLTLIFELLCYQLFFKMEAIYIPQLLKAPKRTREIVLDDSIAGLETLTPIRGTLIVRHGGNFLEVSLKAETIVTLTCDRCLQNYNQRIETDTSELIWLEAVNPDSERLPLEREVSLEDLSETLAPNGHFDPEQWLYEQFSLTMPLRRLCGQDCKGAAKTASDNQHQVDSRWASLASLKEQLSQNQN